MIQNALQMDKDLRKENLENVLVWRMKVIVRCETLELCDFGTVPNKPCIYMFIGWFSGAVSEQRVQCDSSVCSAQQSQTDCTKATIHSRFYY